jgi:mRNA-degrading endonuclease RelE of RelBE toxin-antitoxin system
LTGYRVDQGEYRIIYAIGEANKKVLVGAIINRNEDYEKVIRLSG